MCLIAHRDTIGAHIPNDVIDYNLRSNPDGFGIAWRENGKPISYERFGPDNAKGFRELLKRIDGRSVEYVAHWRKATHGKACVDLSHPFEYTDPQGNRILAFHNGIINIKTNGAQESDTSVFVNRVLARLDYGWWKNSAMVWLVESSIGWSRLLLMTQKEDVIINEEDWKREGGLFYSTNPLGYVAPKGKVVATQTPPSNGYTVNSGSEKSTGQTSLFLPASVSDDDDSIIMADDDEYTKWLHKGHWVVPVSEEATTLDEEDKYGGLVCLDCDAEGEYYVIEGTRYIEIDHLEVLDEE